MHRYSQMFDRMFPVVALISSLGIAVAAIYLANGYLVWTYNVMFDVASWVVLCILGAGILRYFVRENAIIYFAAGLLVYLAAGIGLAQSAAALLFVLSSYLYGRAASNMMFPQQSTRGVTQYILIGLALYLAIFGVMIHYQINYRSIYFAITLAPVLIFCGSGKLPTFWNSLRSTTVASIRSSSLSYAFFALTIAVFSVLCRLVLIPTVGFDDNALHLGMWTQLSYRHIYSFDVVTQIWQVAPFAVDLLHAILSMLADADARPALNLFLLAVLVRQLWVILGHFSLSQSDRCLLVLLFVSTPLVGNQLISLQTELFMAVLVASGVRLALEMQDGWFSPDVAAILAVAAMCCATKLPGAYIGALLALAAIIKLWVTQPRTPLSLTLGRSLLMAGFIGLLAITAFNAYFTAWRITGNPFFPLYNAIFQSPYYDAVNFSDDRWIKGFSLASYVKVFFATSGFFESTDFVAGFQYLFLFPLGVIALLRRTQLHKAFIVLLPLLGFGLVMFSITQYWRYMLPVFPLAAVVIGGLLMKRPSDGNRSLIIVRLAIILCAGLNVYFYPGVSWLLSIPPSSAYTEKERETLIAQFASPRAINKYLNEQAPGMRVLYPDEAPLGSTLNGTPVYAMWYSPARLARAQRIATTEDLAMFLKEEDIDFVISSMADYSKPGTSKWLLGEYLSHAGFPEYRAGDHILYRLLDRDVSYEQVFALDDWTATITTPQVQIASGLPPAGSSIMVTETPLLLTTVQTGKGRIARYRASFSCAQNTGYFVADVRWDIGTSYYRLIPCADNAVNFVEAFPIPAGATQATIHAATWGITEVTVTSLALEIN